MISVVARPSLRSRSQVVAVPGSAYQTLNLLAAVGWLAALALWAARCAPAYPAPRADGRPG